MIKRDKYDRVTSDLVRALRGYTCEKCGLVGKKGADGPQMHAAHIVGRRNAGTRYDLDNILCLCAYHHSYFTERPVEFTDWLREYMGEEKVDAIKLKGWQVHKWKAKEKEALYQDYRKRLKAIETNGSKL